MTSNTSIDLREVIFINQAAKDSYCSLPDEVRQMADKATYVLQNNGRLPAKQRKALSGTLSGIDEIRMDDGGDTYRAYHLVQFREVIYILDAGIKKSPSGKKIPQQQIERLEKRKKAAVEDYNKNKSLYAAEFAEREERKKTLEEAKNPQPR
jgi:phage-related protein